MLNLNFYSGEDLYSDGDIENEILDVFEKELDIYEVLSKDNRWPMLYHLSPERRNLLEWYDFNKEGSLLEIGAGCGALTELFCEKLKRIVAVELSLKRAKIIEKRCERFKNLEIIVGNFENIEVDEKFDYITLIGVLEYTKSFISDKEPYKFLFNKIKNLLKKGGTLIIAIENRLGIKYWAGAREEHTGNFFEGLEGYRTDKVETFGKKELEDLLRGSGFKELKFYYPYPDYKLCFDIFSDEYLPIESTYLPQSPNYDSDRYVIFDEGKVLRNIIRNGLFPYFSNSFLVFARVIEEGKK
ncbi:MAG: class I SAM-dependent methyltransferase [Brevinematia bacterium]